jgi:hypothetical protein
MMLSEESKQLDEELDKMIMIEKSLIKSRAKDVAKAIQKDRRSAALAQKKQLRRDRTAGKRYGSQTRKKSTGYSEQVDKIIDEVRKELKGQVVDPDFQVPIKNVHFSPYNQSELQKKRKAERITTKEAKSYPSKKKIFLTKKQRKRGETPWAKYRSMESIELDQELDQLISESSEEKAI